MASVHRLNTIFFHIVNIKNSISWQGFILSYAAITHNVPKNFYGFETYLYIHICGELGAAESEAEI